MTDGLQIFGASNYSNPSWASEPNIRGTWSLVQSCLLTLSLCVFSAIHPNVFHRESRWWWRWLIRLKWLMLALIAPELIVFNAWSERRQAVRIARLLRQRAGQGEKRRACVPRWLTFWKAKNVAVDDEGIIGSPVIVDDVPRRHHRLSRSTASKEPATIISQRVSDSTTNGKEERFGLVHGFVIVMGGLAVDMSHDPERTWPTYCNRLTLTPACFEECFGRDEFLDINLGFLTKEHISGREKMDHLAKTLIVIQALWFCLQFVARLCQALPVSLLELNTFAHALCALFIYALWWSKPGVIEDQFILHTEESEALQNLCAAQWTSGASGIHYEAQGGRIAEDHFRPLKASEWRPTYVHGGSELLMNFCRGRRNVTLCPGAGEDWYLFKHVDRWFYYPRLAVSDEAGRLRIRTLDATEPAKRFVQGETITGTNMELASPFLSLDVDETTLRRWQRTFKHDEYSHNYTVWLRDRQPNFAWPRGLDSKDGHEIGEELIKSLFMLLATSLCYGGLHMLAWNSAALPSNSPQQLLWKAACLLLMTVGPLGMAVWVGLKIWRGADAHLRLNQSMSIGFGAFTVVMFVAYLASRIYLVVEVIIVIPYLDPGVYETVEFSEYWPHIG